jgi:dolichol-phosphate mannosyltransferase
MGDQHFGDTQSMISQLKSRLDVAGILGPLIDVVAYFAATAAGTLAARSQAVSFAVAVALRYLPQLYAQAKSRSRTGNLTFYLHLVAVTLLLFFLRSGVFGLLTSGWGWPGQIAIVISAAVTGAMIRPAYAHCIEYAKWSLSEGAGWRMGAVAVVAFVVLLRLIYGAQVELLPEETYYWNYSRHLDFGYLDHPPMVGWLISAGTAAFGNTEFGVRIGALFCVVVAAFFTYRLTRNLFGEPSAVVAVLLMQTLPFFFLTGMLMTPDAPLTAAWAAALYFLERALIAGKSAAWWGVGVCLGLGLLSKYTIGLLGLSALIFILLDSRSRRWLRRWEPYAAALLALAIFSPVIIWNAHNEWASFVFQTSRRLAERPRFALHRLIASALVLLTPTGLAAAVVALVERAPASAGPTDSMDERRAWRFIQVTILLPLAVFIVFSLRHEVKLDWTGAPWVAAIPALAFGIVQSGQKLATGVRAWIQATWVPTIVVLLLLYGALLYHLAIGIPGLGYGKHAELVPVGWRELGANISRVAEATEKSNGQYPLVVGMDRYAIASELAFYAPDRAKSVAATSSAHLFGQVGLMYERWFPIDRQKGRTLLLVAWGRGDLASERLNSNVERLDPIQEGELRRDHAIIRPYYYRLAYGYRGNRARSE